MEQESELEQLFASEGRPWPYQKSEDEARMYSELREAMRLNGRENFSYSRGPGSGLRVPEHTDLRGDPERRGSGGQQDIMGGGLQQNQQQQQQWSSPDFNPKEEDEFGMDLH